VPQVRRENRKGHASCVSEEVCANSVISKIKNLKKLLTRPASLEMAGYADHPSRNDEKPLF
jgi:hypothetical protein